MQQLEDWLDSEREETASLQRTIQKLKAELDEEQTARMACEKDLARQKDMVAKAARDTKERIGRWKRSLLEHGQKHGFEVVFDDR